MQVAKARFRPKGLTAYFRQGEDGRTYLMFVSEWGERGKTASDAWYGREVAWYRATNSSTLRVLSTITFLACMLLVQVMPGSAPTRYRAPRSVSLFATPSTVWRPSKTKRLNATRALAVHTSCLNVQGGLRDKRALLVFL